jgi:hypothetical protein
LPALLAVGRPPAHPSVVLDPVARGAQCVSFDVHCEGGSALDGDGDSDVIDDFLDNVNPDDNTNVVHHDGDDDHDDIHDSFDLDGSNHVEPIDGDDDDDNLGDLLGHVGLDSCIHVEPCDGDIDNDDIHDSLILDDSNFVGPHDGDDDNDDIDDIFLLDDYVGHPDGDDVNDDLHDNLNLDGNIPVEHLDGDDGNDDIDDIHDNAVENELSESECELSESKRVGETRVRHADAASLALVRADLVAVQVVPGRRIMSIADTLSDSENQRTIPLGLCLLICSVDGDGDFVCCSVGDCDLFPQCWVFGGSLRNFVLLPADEPEENMALVRADLVAAQVVHGRCVMSIADTLSDSKDPRPIPLGLLLTICSVDVDGDFVCCPVRDCDLFTECWVSGDSLCNFVLLPDG